MVASCLWMFNFTVIPTYLVPLNVRHLPVGGAGGRMEVFVLLLIWERCASLQNMKYFPLWSRLAFFINYLTLVDPLIMSSPPDVLNAQGLTVLERLSVRCLFPSLPLQQHVFYLLSQGNCPTMSFEPRELPTVSIYYCRSLRTHSKNIFNERMRQLSLCQIKS